MSSIKELRYNNDMHTVTVYSNWESEACYTFDTLEEAREFAAEMKDQQYLCKIESTTEM